MSPESSSQAELSLLRRRVRELRIVVFGLIVVLVAERISGWLDKPPAWQGLTTTSVSLTNWYSQPPEPTAVLSGGGKESPARLVMGLDSKYRARVELSSGNGHHPVPTLSLNGLDGRPRAELVVTEQGSGMLRLYDAGGEVVETCPRQNR